MKEHNQIEKEVLITLKYFNFFSFPLSLGELHQYIQMKCIKSNLQETLDNLVNSKDIFIINDCYSLVDNMEIVNRKKEGYILAQKRLKKAKNISKIIYLFPFVRMISVSGSLSKGYADNDSDIDFFIITTENNLWTARTLLHLFKKITFLFNLQHSFCMNYFIANKHLKIEEQNYFTALELATLTKIKGAYYHEQLLEKNRWVKTYLPNFDFEESREIHKSSKGGKWMLEKLFVARRLNNFLMKLTHTKWKRKWKSKGYTKEDYELAFKTNLYISKNHPANYQKQMLNHINE